MIKRLHTINGVLVEPLTQMLASLGPKAAATAVKPPANQEKHKASAPAGAPAQPYTASQLKAQATATPQSVQVAPPTPQMPLSAPPISMNTLYYGGSASAKTAKLGSKPKEQVNFKSQRRYETIIRCENAGVSERQLAAMLAISVPRLRTIKKTPEYLAARMKITFGIVVDHQASLSQIKEQQREYLTQYMPEALSALANTLMAPAITVPEKKLRLQAAQDILDREGTFAKISKTEIKAASLFDFAQADSSSSEIIAAIRAVAPAPPAHASARGGPQAPLSASSGAAAQASINVQNIIQLSDLFSKSHTISVEDQQAAMQELEQQVLLAVRPASEEVQ